MELTFDVQKILVFMLAIIVNHLPGVSGLIMVDTNVTSCDGTGVNIPFSVDLQTGSILADSEIWYYETTLVATKSGGVFLPETNYTSRLHSYSTYGLTLDNVTDADKGRYLFVFFYLSPTPQGAKTATATLLVNVKPSENCVPIYRQDGASAICELNSTANCGSPRLVPIWTNTSANASGNSFTVIQPGNYTCCATGSILADCYRGSSSFCRTFNVAVPTTTAPPGGGSNDCDCIIWIPVIVAVLLFAVIVIDIVSICIKCKSWVIWILIIVKVLLLLACGILIIVNILIYKICNSIWILVIVAVLLFVHAVIEIICRKYKTADWVIWILIIDAVLLLLAGVILIIMVNIYLKYKNCFIWIIVAVLLLLLGLIVIVRVIIYKKYKKWQRRPICVSCKKNKCEYCKESFGILICKCEKSFGRLICNFCKKNNCKDCKESAGIVICKCCLMKKCKDCAESARTLLCKSHNMKNCDACTESSGILICRFCEKENCKGCTKSTEMLICKCCDSERNENPEKKLICNCCKQMKCKSCSVSPEKESFRMLICKCCNLKYKRNHEDGRRSASENGQQENVNKRNPDSSMSNVSRKDIEIQMEGNVVNRDLERAFGSPNKVGIELRDGPKYESVSFDLHEIRPLPLQPKNDRTQRGLSANFEDNQGLPSDRSNKLPPLNHQLQSTIQEEDTIKRPRKTKKKKGKNKTGDESKNVDELAESK